MQLRFERNVHHRAMQRAVEKFITTDVRLIKTGYAMQLSTRGERAKIEFTLAGNFTAYDTTLLLQQKKLHG